MPTLIESIVEDTIADEALRREFDGATRLERRWLIAALTALRARLVFEQTQGSAFDLADARIDAERAAGFLYDESRRHVVEVPRVSPGAADR